MPKRLLFLLVICLTAFSVSSSVAVAQESEEDPCAYVEDDSYVDVVPNVDLPDDEGLFDDVEDSGEVVDIEDGTLSAASSSHSVALPPVEDGDELLDDEQWEDESDEGDEEEWTDDEWGEDDDDWTDDDYGDEDGDEPLDDDPTLEPTPVTTNPDPLTDQPSYDGGWDTPGEMVSGEINVEFGNGQTPSFDDEDYGEFVDCGEDESKDKKSSTSKGKSTSKLALVGRRAKLSASKKRLTFYVRCKSEVCPATTISLTSGKLTLKARTKVIKTHKKTKVVVKVSKSQRKALGKNRLFKVSGLAKTYNLRFRKS